MVRRSAPGKLLSSEDNITRGSLFRLKVPAYLFFLYFAVSLSLFFSSLGNYFSADDFLILLNVSKPGFFSVFNHINFHFIPFPLVLYKLLFLAAGLDPAPYKILNLLIHSFACVVVFKLSLRVFRLFGKEENERPVFLKSLVTSLFFCVHYIHTEAVIYFSCLHEIVYSVAYLLCFNFYLKYRETGEIKNYVLLLASFLLSLLSKETAVGFLLFLLVMDVLVFKSSFKLFIRKYSPLIVLAVLYAVLRMNISRTLEGFIFTFEPAAVAMEVIKNLSFTFTSCLVSLDFMSIKDIYKSNSADPLMTIKALWGASPLIIVILALIVLLYVYIIWKRDPVIRFGFAFILFTILPFIWLTVYERYMYLPSFGFAVILIQFLFSYSAKGRFKVYLVSAFLIIIFSYNIFSLLGKKNIWETASEISFNAVSRIKFISWNMPLNSTVYFRDLPDNYRGAWIFRDGVQYFPELLLNRSDLKFQRIYGDELSSNPSGNVFVFRYVKGEFHYEK